jgi:sporulation protein YlmC with PRC-barrel domain
MREDEMDLVYRLLDDQIIDCDGRRCGRVDDLEFDGQFGQPVYLASILSGPGAWPGRLPRRLRGVATRVFGSGILGERVVHVPWAEVDEVAQGVVRLRRRASEVGLGREDHLSKTIQKLPDS